MVFYFDFSFEDQCEFAKKSGMDKWLGPAFQDLASTNRLSDCRFVIETADGNKRTFECHKLIFSCASNVFERMFYGEFVEAQSNEIVLDNVHPDIFAKFREYIYCYDIKLLIRYDETTLIDLAKFAQQYLVSSVTRECCEILCDRTESADIAVLIQLYQFGNDIFHLELIQRVWEFITFRYHNAMNHTAVYQLSSDVFYKYIVMSKKTLKEIMRYKMIEKYLKENNHKMSDVITTPSDDYAPKVSGNTLKDYQDCQYFESFYSFFDTVEEDDQEFLRKERIKRIKNKKTKEIFQFTHVKNVYIKNLLELIDFKQMTPQEFYEGPGKSKFFDAQEKYKMLYETTLPKPPYYTKKNIEFKFK